MARKKCPREGTRLQFDATPASAALYSHPPLKGEVGTVVSLPLGGKRATCTGGHGQDLVYVNWPSVGTMGVARSDTKKAMGKGPRSLQVNGITPIPSGNGPWVIIDKMTGGVLDVVKTREDWKSYPYSSYRKAPDRYQILTEAEYSQRRSGGVSGASIDQRVSTPMGPGRVTMASGKYVGVQLDNGEYVHLQASQVTPTGEKQRFMSGVQYQHPGE